MIEAVPADAPSPSIALAVTLLLNPLAKPLVLSHSAIVLLADRLECDWLARSLQALIRLFASKIGTPSAS